MDYVFEFMYSTNNIIKYHTYASANRNIIFVITNSQVVSSSVVHKAYNRKPMTVEGEYSYNTSCVIQIMLSIKKIGSLLLELKKDLTKTSNANSKHS